MSFKVEIMTNSYMLGPFDRQPMVIELDSAPPTDPRWVTRPEPGVEFPKSRACITIPRCQRGRWREREREERWRALFSKVFNYLHSGPCPTCSLTPADTTNNCQTDDRQINQSTPVEKRGKFLLRRLSLHTNQQYGSFIAGQGKSMLTISSKLQLLAMWQWVNAITTSRLPGWGFASNNPLVTRGCSR